MSQKQETIHRYVTLDQIDDLRDAAHKGSGNLALRNEVLVVVMIDLGLRANEARQLTREMFDLDAEEVMLPSSIQKDYPIENETPPSATMRLDPYGHFSTVRLLRTYFNSDWWQSRATNNLFPSRQSEQMTTRSIRNTVQDLAKNAGVKPRRTDGKASIPDEMHPHALRHSLANYMLADEETRVVDVRNRLRHRSITTTERIYEHFQRR